MAQQPVGVVVGGHANPGATTLTENLKMPYNVSVHEDVNYIVECADCDEYPKVCSTEWAAEYAASEHRRETFGPTHSVSYRELPENHDWERA